MVGHHASVVVAKAIRGTTIYSSFCRSGHYIYHAEQPMRGFPLLPVDYAAFHGIYEGDKQQLYDELDGKGTYYLACEVYMDYNSPDTKELKLCVRNELCDNWSVYTLTMPPEAPAEAMDTEDAPYPQPGDWFYAIHMRYDGEENYAEHVSRL